MMKSYRLSLLAAALLVLLPSCGQAPGLQRELEEYIAGAPAEIGLAVITPAADTIVVNPGRYPMNSVMKMFQALPAAEKMNRDGIRWDSVINVARSELQTGTWSPMLRDHPGSTIRVSCGELLEYSLSQSDNNASDLLFDKIADIEATNRFWQKKGITDFRIKWNEAQMHEDQKRCDDNWTTPLAAAEAIGTLVPCCLGASDSISSRIVRAMTDCATGINRIPAGLDMTGALIAHKTGTGFEDARGNPEGVNDVAFIRLPDGRTYSLAIFVRTSETGIEETERMIADISRIVYTSICQDK